MTIAGIGVDRVVIARINRSVERFGTRFLQRIYTDAEIAQSQAKGNPSRRFAMLFAAKEAVSKALGTGFHQGVAPRDIETIHLPSGKPAVTLYGGARRVAEKQGVTAVHVSLTDDDGIAMAFVVAELDS
ncbi:holo-ACP synthase [Mariprofundus ferrooxydans]|uniref:Holo-[acyl-carrier-protein] synthase n=1 Tax=Mariprofundus ferrooxydans PV-1 TaxID=314345 RepID=Q0F3I8_9PROT|nr:holo-ACP synthase [Mariprofundus ferrooxydans]EAU55953.1 4'-phosphopantetheinyl transferase [Mariprofundus ferrooxydans PV-1]KON48227.1 4-phosphopantetheinyl transferase [Mariprofundus ferrooxydans]